MDSFIVFRVSLPQTFLRLDWGSASWIRNSIAYLGRVAASGSRGDESSVGCHRIPWPAIGTTRHRPTAARGTRIDGIGSWHDIRH